MYVVTKEIRDEFIRGLRERRVYPEKLPTKSINKLKDVSFAAVKLFDSGTPFLLRGKDRQEYMREDDSQLLKNTLAPLVEQFWKYFNKKKPYKTQQEFDVFHEELCKMFLDIWTGWDYSYGNAQKFVNMLFKYLACFSDSEEYAKWFKYCHLTLDRYTYNGYCLPFYQDVVYPAMHGCPAGELNPWTKLSKEEYLGGRIDGKEYPGIIKDIVAYVTAHPKTYNDYLAICQDKNLDLFKGVDPLEEDYELTPFEAEFFLWAIAKACKEKKDDGQPIDDLVESLKARL